MEMSF